MAASIALAQPPAVTKTTPSTLRPGESVSWQIHGSQLAGVRQVWTSFAPVVTIADDADKGNGSLVTVSLTVPSDAPLGLNAVRVLTDNGVSPLSLIVVDDLPVVASPGNNTSLETALAVPVPSSVDGAIANLTMQYIRFPAAAGQTLQFEVLASRIGSALDPSLRILNSAGREIAFVDDTSGLAGDCQLSVTFETAGDYFVELRDIRYQGGAYHLRIGEFPLVSAPYPLAVQRGTAAEIVPAGIAVANVAPAAINATADPAQNWQPVAFRFPDKTASGFGHIAVVDTPQTLEIEPNNSLEQAQAVTAGNDLQGRLQEPGDVDFFQFTAKKGESWLLRGITRTVGSPTDLNLRLLKKDGSQIAAVDDTNTDEGELTFACPEDGDYILVVEDLTRRGGSEQAYWIEFRRTAPSFKLAVSSDVANVPRGGTIALTATAVRKGYGGPIELTVENLPEGATASHSVIGPGRNDAILTVTIPAELANSELRNVLVVGTGKVGDNPLRVVATSAGAVQARNNTMRWPARRLEESVAFAAAPAEAVNLTIEPAEVVLGKHLAASIKIKAARSQDLVEAIALAVEPAQNGLPPEVTFDLKPVAKGETEATVTIKAGEKTPLGEFTAFLRGTLKQDKTTVTPAVPAIRFKVDAPMTVSLTGPAEPLKRGGTAVAKVQVVRNPALSGPVTVTLDKLPQGVTAAPVTIAADADTAEITLTAAADAAVGETKTTLGKAEVMVGDKKLEAASAVASLTVVE